MDITNVKTKMKIVATIEAGMTSAMLPVKGLKPLVGRPVLELNRTRDKLMRILL